MLYFSPGLTLPDSEAVVEASSRTRKNPVGVSFMITKGFLGSGNCDADCVEDCVKMGVLAGNAEGDASAVAPPEESASLRLAINLYPAVVLMVSDLV